MGKKALSAQEVREARLAEGKRLCKIIRTKLEKEPTYSMAHVDAIEKRMDATKAASIPQLYSLKSVIEKYDI